MESPSKLPPCIALKTKFRLEKAKYKQKSDIAAYRKIKEQCPDSYFPLFTNLCIK